MCRNRDKQKQNQAKVETIEWTQNNTHGVIRRNHQVLCERSHAHRHVVHVLILQRSSTKQGGKRRLFNLTFEGKNFFLLISHVRSMFSQLSRALQRAGARVHRRDIK